MGSERCIRDSGSHDLILDVLADYLRRRHPHLTLSSSNVGSYGGLLALARGEAHLAGSHLLDEATGEYNVSYVAELLPGVPVVLLGFVQRTQGLIVPAGNPKGIRTLHDLARPDVVFINRCLLYNSDAPAEPSRVVLGGRRTPKKKT